MPRTTAHSGRKKSADTTWCWRRWIEADRQELWIGRLHAQGCASWAFTERPLRLRVLLEVYLDSRAAAVALTRSWGGSVRAVSVREWIGARPAPPTRLGRRLEIVHETTGSRKPAFCPRLHIPHGLAFGSGEHATTFMLLRALVRDGDLSPAAARGPAILDLGTGSGVLALTARLLGAQKIVATDFDPDAVRTARQNEALNFPRPLVRWRCADVRKLRATARYDLVLANLFSGILCEAAPQIAASVAPGGRLWLSGILHSQQEEIAAAYRRRGLKLIRAVRRGKWVLLMLRSTEARRAQEAAESGGAK